MELTARQRKHLKAQVTLLGAFGYELVLAGDCIRITHPVDNYDVRYISKMTVLTSSDVHTAVAELFAGPWSGNPRLARERA